MKYLLIVLGIFFFIFNVIFLYCALKLSSMCDNNQKL